MDYGYTGIDIIVFLVSISLGIFILAVLIRLWSVLDDVRLACRLFREGNPSVEMLAIKMCENGKNVYDIARELKISLQVVRGWCLEPLRKRAIIAFKDGKAPHLIGSALGVPTSEVERWIAESNEEDNQGI